MIFFRNNKFVIILLVLLMMLHITANEGNKVDRNVTSRNSSWTDTCAITYPQALPVVFLWLDMYNCRAFIDILLDIGWQLEEHVLYSIFSAIILLIISYWKFRNLNQGGSGDNHHMQDTDDYADDDGDFGRDYDARKSIVQFPIAVSESCLSHLYHPGFISPSPMTVGAF